MGISGGIQGLHFVNTMNNAGLRKGATEAKGIISGLSGNIASMAPFLPLAAGATILAGLSDAALDFANEFGMAMREVQTISEAVQEDFEGISDQIIDMAAQGPDDAIELAKAYYQIVSAGYDGAAGLNLLDVANRAATAGITDTKTAADGLTTILNAWGKDASEAENVADILFKTVEKGKTTFPELASNIATVAPMASAMDISLEEITGAIATLTKQGNTTPVAMTQIRQAIIGLNENLGDGWSKAMTLQEGLQKLRDMAGGSDTKLKELMGRVEGMNAVLSLTGDKTTEATEDLDTMTTAVGSMQTAYETMMEEADNKWSMVHNKWQRELKGLGSAAKVASTGLADAFNALLTDPEDIEILPKSISTFTDKVAALKALGNSAGMSWLSAGFTKSEDLENRLKAVVKKANAGFTDKETKLTEILGIKDANEQLEKLQKYLEEIQKESSTDLKYRDDSDGGTAINSIRKKKWESIIESIETAIEKAKEFDNGNGGGGGKVKVWTATESKKTIKDLKKQLGTGTADNDVELLIAIDAEQQKLNAFYEKVREKFTQAINDGLVNSNFKTLDADNTNTETKSLEITGLKTKEIKAQLAPVKTLTKQEKEALKTENDKLEALHNQTVNYQKLLSSINQISGAVSEITNEYGEQLGLTEDQAKCINDGMNALQGVADIAQGNYVGGVLKIASSIISQINSRSETLAERFAEIYEYVNMIVASMEVANETFNNLGSGDIAAFYALAEVQKQLTGLIDDAKELNEQFDENTSYQPRIIDKTSSNSYFRTVDYESVRESMSELESEMNELASHLYGYISTEQREAIESLLNSYNELVSEMDSITESLIGTTVDDLATSLVDAFLEGEDAAEAWGDKVNDIVRNIVTQQLVATYLNEPIQAAVDELIANMGTSDNGNGSSGRTNGNSDSDSGDEDSDIVSTEDIESFSNSVLAAIESASPAIEAIIEALEASGISFSDSDNSQSASSGGYETISEDTASVLEGRFTALQMYGAEMLTLQQQMQPDIVSINNYAQLTAESVKETRDISLLSVDYLSNISNYTSVLPTMASDIEKIKKNTAGL